MDRLPDPTPEPPSRISAITTLAQLAPEDQIRRYQRAVHRYLVAVLKGKGIPNAADAADDVLQTVLAKFVSRQLAGWPGQGRFRDYLKQIAYNAAMDYLRGRQALRRKEISEADLPSPGDLDARAVLPDESELEEEFGLTALDNAMKRLKVHEEGRADNVFFTLIKFRIDELDKEIDDTAPEGPSANRLKKLCEELEQKTGNRFTPDNVRQQLRRARLLLTEMLLDELRTTMDRPTPVQLLEELARLKLLAAVRNYLPDELRLLDQASRKPALSSPTGDHPS
jgi:RNA polymerase sigma factor (sigma-70 family)